MSSASPLLQVLFFGFGWLFFMRKLFKDYEVRRGLSLQFCILKLRPVIAISLKLLLAFFLSLSSLILFLIVFTVTFFFISSVLVFKRLLVSREMYFFLGPLRVSILETVKLKKTSGGRPGVIEGFPFCLSKLALHNCRISKSKSN